MSLKASRTDVVSAVKKRFENHLTKKNWKWTKESIAFSMAHLHRIKIFNVSVNVSLAPMSDELTQRINVAISNSFRLTPFGLNCFIWRKNMIGINDLSAGFISLWSAACTSEHQNRKHILVATCIVVATIAWWHSEVVQFTDTFD